jgi:protein deglycase
MKKVLVPLAEGFEEIEAITIIDVLRRAGIEVITASVTNQHEVTGSHNITIKADKIFNEVNGSNFDMIVLPGGMPGSVNLNQHVGLKEMLHTQKNQDKFIGAICAAPLVLGNMGLLKGVKATCYPGFEKFLEGAELSTEGVVTDGQTVTARGAGLALSFALKLVEILADENIAQSVGKKMLVG